MMHGRVPEIADVRIKRVVSFAKKIDLVLFCQTGNSCRPWGSGGLEVRFSLARGRKQLRAELTPEHTQNTKSTPASPQTDPGKIGRWRGHRKGRGLGREPHRKILGEGCLATRSLNVLLSMKVSMPLKAVCFWLTRMTHRSPTVFAVREA